MSSLPYNAGPAPFFPARFQDFEQKRAAILKHVAASERLVEVRPASRLEVRPRPEMLSTGVPEIDALSGGIPCGHLSKIYGAPSSGKTSALLAAIAAATRRDETCVLIDASDSFDPASGQAAGVEFGRLLWVRCGGYKRKFLWEHRLEQVLKTTDLILQSGGFGLVALDLAGIPEKFVRRIPLASWFRFQRAVEHTKTALLVITEFRCAESCAALILKFENQLSTVRRQSSTPTHTQLIESMQLQVEIVRSRLERKPMQSVKSNFVTRSLGAG